MGGNGTITIYADEARRLATAAGNAADRADQVAAAAAAASATSAHAVAGTANAAAGDTPAARNEARNARGPEAAGTVSSKTWAAGNSAWLFHAVNPPLHRAARLSGGSLMTLMPSARPRRRAEQNRHHHYGIRPAEPPDRPTCGSREGAAATSPPAQPAPNSEGRASGDQPGSLRKLWPGRHGGPRRNGHPVGSARPAVSAALDAGWDAAGAGRLHRCELNQRVISVRRAGHPALTPNSQRGLIPLDRSLWCGNCDERIRHREEVTDQTLSAAQTAIRWPHERVFSPLCSSSISL